MVCGSHGGRAIIVRGNVRCRGGMWPVVLDLVMSELIVLGLYLSGVYVVGGMAWWGGGGGYGGFFGRSVGSVKRRCGLVCYVQGREHGLLCW